MQKGELENQPKDLGLLDVGFSQDMECDVHVQCTPLQPDAEVDMTPVVAEPQVAECIQGTIEDFDDDDIVVEFDEPVGEPVNEPVGEPVDAPVAVEVEVEDECEVDMTPVITEPQVADCIQGTFEDFDAEDSDEPVDKSVAVDCEVEVEIQVDEMPDVPSRSEMTSLGQPPPLGGSEMTSLQELPPLGKLSPYQEPPSVDYEVEVESPTNAVADRLTKLREVFKVFDSDNTNSLESSELLELGKARRSMGHKKGEWTEEMNARLVKEMDTDADGKVDEFEFSKHFEKALPHDEEEFNTIIAQFLKVANACTEQKQKANIAEATRSEVEIVVECEVEVAVESEVEVAVDNKVEEPPSSKQAAAADETFECESSEEEVNSDDELAAQMEALRKRASVSKPPAQQAENHADAISADNGFNEIVRLFGEPAFQLPLSEFIDAHVDSFMSGDLVKRQVVWQDYDQLIESRTTEQILTIVTLEQVEDALAKLTADPTEYSQLTIQLTAADEFEIFEKMMTEVASDRPDAPDKQSGDQFDEGFDCESSEDVLSRGSDSSLTLLLYHSVASVLTLACFYSGSSSLSLFVIDCVLSCWCW